MRSVLSAFCVLLSTTTLVVASPLASKHNIYLASCTRPRNCLLIICDNPSTFTAAAYYANGAATSNNPTELATITSPASPWEGVPRQGRFRTGVVSSTIDAGAKSLAKGEIAGAAKLGSEEFICFRDGESKFTWTGWDDLDLQRADCVADYWCASTSK